MSDKPIAEFRVILSQSDVDFITRCRKERQEEGESKKEGKEKEEEEEANNNDKAVSTS